MKHFFLSCLISLSAFLTAQSNLSKTEFNLGTIELRNDDVIDINIYNSISETLYLLRTEASGNASFKYTNTSLKPGYTETVRIKLNPKQIGKIVEVVKLYYSNSEEPIEITIKGKVKSIAKNSLQACPSFKSGRTNINANGVYNPAGEIKAFSVKLYNPEEDIAKVTEEETSEKEESPISNEERTDYRKPREPKKKPVYNDRRNQPSLDQILFGKTEENDSSNVNKPQTEEVVEVIKSEVEEEILEEETKNPNLLDNSYKPNNVVFLIDASTSMRKDEKMDLLKKAMIELLNPLRSIDYLSIVTYSGESQVLLSPTSAINKEEIEKIIENINADGSTQAAKGIKKAIQVAKSNFIEGGNNQIILATDGAFDIGERNKSLRIKIASEANKGLTITVLGIKNERWTNKSLNEISELGNGDLIRINNQGDTQKVLEEVKKQSKF